MARRPPAGVEVVDVDEEYWPYQLAQLAIAQRDDGTAAIEEARGAFDAWMSARENNGHATNGHGWPFGRWWPFIPFSRGLRGALAVENREMARVRRCIESIEAMLEVRSHS